ncbi:MAG: hypothetical protein WBW33_35815 [Bryobacteraceae bacterium]
MRTFPNILVSGFVASLLGAVALYAQAPSLELPEPTPVLIQAELSTPVKLAKAKVGDKLKAVTVAQVNVPNSPVIPAGSTVMGQVQKVDGAFVTVSFDQVNVDGKKISLNITLVAAALMGGPKTETTDGNAKATKSANNSPGADAPLRPGEVRTTLGTVVGLPGVALAVDDVAPFASRFELNNKEQQLPKGLQLMFKVR